MWYGVLCALGLYQITQSSCWPDGKPKYDIDNATPINASTVSGSGGSSIKGGGNKAVIKGGGIKGGGGTAGPDDPSWLYYCIKNSGDTLKGAIATAEARSFDQLSWGVKVCVRVVCVLCAVCCVVCCVLCVI